MSDDFDYEPELCADCPKEFVPPEGVRADCFLCGEFFCVNHRGQLKDCTVCGEQRLCNECGKAHNCMGLDDHTSVKGTDTAQ